MYATNIILLYYSINKKTRDVRLGETTTVNDENRATEYCPVRAVVPRSACRSRCRYLGIGLVLVWLYSDTSELRVAVQSPFEVSLESLLMVSTFYSIERWRDRSRFAAFLVLQALTGSPAAGNQAEVPGANVGLKDGLCLRVERAVDSVRPTSQDTHVILG